MAPQAKAQQKRMGHYRPHDKLTTKFLKPSRTKQEFREDCDVNVIIRRFTKSGILPSSNANPQYIDAASLPDLQGAMAIMLEAEKHFMSLPAQVRKEFDNSPVKYVEFATDPKNIDVLREWGIAPKLPPKPEPQKVEIVNPAEPKGTVSP